MNKEELKAIILRSVTGFGTFALAITLYFTFLRYSELKGVIRLGMRIMTPFIIGGVMAYLLKIPCKYFEERLKKILPEKGKSMANGLSVLLVMLLTFMILYLLLAMVLPEVFNSIAALTAALPAQINKFTRWINSVTESESVISTYVSALVEEIGVKFRSWSQTELLPTLEGMMGGFASTLSNIFGFLMNLMVGTIVCIYILLSRKKFVRQGKAVVFSLFDPAKAEKIIEEFRFIDKTFVGFFGGKILDSAIVGLICYIFCLIMSITRGMPNAMLVSLIVGITNVIPYFGPYIGAVPSALLILMSSPVNCLIFLVFIIILQQIDGNVLGPKLLANSVGLSGFWVLFAITVFGGIMGFAGVLIGVPVFAVIYDFLKRYVLRGLRKHNKLDVLQDTEDKVLNEKKEAKKNAEKNRKK